MAKEIKKTSEEKAVILKKISEDKKTMKAPDALRRAGISPSTYFKWQKQLKPSSIQKRNKKEPRLITLPIPESTDQQMCVIFGPSDKVQSALTRIAEIYRK